MSEKQLMDDIRASLMKTGDVRMYRNNVGMTYTLCDRCKNVACKVCLQRATHPIRYGLAVGSADLVGLLKGSGRWFAIEVKTAKGRASDEQKAWLDVMRKDGAVAEIAKSVEQACAILERAKNETR